MLIIYFHSSVNDPLHVTQAVYKYDYSKEAVKGEIMNVDNVLLGKMHKKSRQFFDEYFKPGSYKIFDHSEDDDKIIYRVAPLLE